MDIHGHRFKIYTLVSEIHENVDLVLGIKNVFELEGVINSRDCCFEFLNRSVPIYPEKKLILKLDEQKLVKVKAPFIDEISGLAIIKIIDGGTYSTLLIKLKFVNTLKREREQTTLTDKYPWLDLEDERKHMTDRDILEKYVNLNNSCLNKEEKLKVMDMLYKYREAFSLRDEIGTCPNIEVEIDVTDKSPFFIRPYHVREEDKGRDYVTWVF